MPLPATNPGATPDATASPWRHLPNLITALRMLLVVPIAWMIRSAYYDSALLVATFAGASDALDGFLAKRYGWQSWLGGVLDPIADKLLLVACFISLSMIGAHPDWLTWLVVGRDVLIVAGAVAYHNLVGPVTAQPTLLSKITTCVQIAYVLAQLMHLSRWFELPQWLLLGLIALTAATTLASGLHYVALWSLRARREYRARHRRTHDS